MKGVSSCTKSIDLGTKLIQYIEYIVTVLDTMIEIDCEFFRYFLILNGNRLDIVIHKHNTLLHRTVTKITLANFMVQRYLLVCPRPRCN